MDHTTSISTKVDVLVLDDEKQWRQTMERVLKDEFTVHTVAKFDEAKRVILDSLPPVVVTDIRLENADVTNQDGLLLLKEIRRLAEKVNVVVITGFPSIETVRTALGEYRAYDYVEKYPLDYKAFRQIIRNAYEDAIKQRPVSYTTRQRRAIVVENDPVLRHNIVASLELEGLIVEMTTLGEAVALLKSEAFDIVVIDKESLTASPLLQRELNRPGMQARFVISATDLDEVADILVHPGFLGYIRKGTDFDANTFRWTIRRAVSPFGLRWIVAKIEGVQPDEELRIGETYKLVLTAQDQKPLLRGHSLVSIRLLPDELNPTLRVDVFARGVDVLPGSSRDWQISLTGTPTQLEFNLIPRSPGNHKLVVDLSREGVRWLQKLEMELLVQDI